MLYLWICLAFIVGLGAGYGIWLTVTRKGNLNARKQSDDILEEARSKAEHVVKDAEVKAKEDAFKRREELDKEAQQARSELRQWEKRIGKQEDSLERKLDMLTKKERYLENTEKNLSKQRADIETREGELNSALDRQRQELEKIAGLSRQEATKLLLDRLEKELDAECAALIARKTEEAREEAETAGKHVITQAIQRYAAEHTAEAVVSTVELPGDDMKGRIIGREGRNIRAFEKATGVDVIVDDTPGVIVLSAYDSVRREIARLSMQRLISDGRIHPARIEEVVAGTRQEIMEVIMETGKRTCYEVGVHSVPPPILELMGRLRYRTSYGQNVLQHSVEVCNLAGLMASELGLDVRLAKRCGLLHDIGKAIDHEQEGSHAVIGADAARRCEELPEVVNSIASHHEEVPQQSVYAALVAGADAISASRPGARRETIERYIKRLERLESIAKEQTGVESAYAIQAGREVRVIVNSDKVDDKVASRICRDIAKNIQSELKYPGEITVTVIRETRVVEKAR